MRTNEEIRDNPEIGDTIQGKYIGYQGHSKFARFIWWPCNNCGEPKWVKNTVRERNVKRCIKCIHKRKSQTKLYRPEVLNLYHPNAEGKYRTVRKEDIPKEGDIIRGGEINKNILSIYRWSVCPRCGFGRWIYNGVYGNPMCKDCGNIVKRNKYIGEKSSQWKGGRITSHYGYIFVIIRPDDPYYPMANQQGYVAEHRLVMAKHLGRCLKRWEVVHHKNGNKKDNRIENLELMSSKYTHQSITILERKVKELEEKIRELTNKQKLNEWKIKELESELQIRRNE